MELYVNTLKFVFAPNVEYWTSFGTFVTMEAPVFRFSCVLPGENPFLGSLQVEADLVECDVITICCAQSKGSFIWT